MPSTHDSAEVEEAEFRSMKHQFAAWKLYKLENERVKAILREIGKGWETGSSVSATDTFRQAAATRINNLRLRGQANVRQLAAYSIITQNPPSLTVLRTAQVFSIFVALTELAIITATVVLSDQSGGALVVGTILAGSCYVAGLGLGTILFKLFERPNRDLDIDAGHIRIVGWARFLVAMIAVVGMAWLRWRDAEEEAIAILVFTSAFSALVVCLTAFAQFLSERYQNNFHTYYLGECSRATKEHGNDFAAATKSDVTLENFDKGVNSSWLVGFSEGVEAQRDLSISSGGARVAHAASVPRESVAAQAQRSLPVSPGGVRIAQTASPPRESVAASEESDSAPRNAAAGD